MEESPSMTMKKQRKMRVGVIGCGAIGALHAKAIRESAYAQLVSVCDVDARRAAAVARGTRATITSNLKAMLGEKALDAVTVATPDHLHVQPVLDALHAGCHVFCEKPLAATTHEAARMIRLARQCGRSLAVDYNRRFGFGYQMAKQLIESGRIGKVRGAVIHVMDGLPPPQVANRPYALLKALLSHHIDLMCWFCGKATEVRALFGPRNESVALSFRFGKGAVGTIVGGWRKGQARTVETMEISGAKGVVRIEDVMREVSFWSDDPDDVQHFRPNYFTGNHDFYSTMTVHLQSFLERIACGQKPLVTGEDGWCGLKIIEAAIEGRNP